MTPWTAVQGLLFVLAFSMLRDAIEDLRRWKSDIETNKYKIKILRNGEFKDAKSKSLKVGDVVMV